MVPIAGTLTTTQAACHIPELWSSKTRDATEANVVAAGLVESSDFGLKELKGGPGDTLNIPYISNPTANTKTANTNITLEQIGPSNAEASQTFTVGTHQHVAFALENITKVQSKTDLMNKYSGKAGYALGAAADTNLHTLPQNFSQSVGTQGVEPTEANWLRAAQYLDDALAPAGERFIVVRPATFYAMQKTNRYTNADYAGSENARTALERNRIDRIHNADVFITTLVRAASAGQADNWFCHRKGVYYCSQDMKTNSANVIERDADVFLATHIYGYAEALQPPVTAGGGSATDVFNVLVAGVS